MLVKAHYIDDSGTLESWVMRYLFVLCAFLFIKLFYYIYSTIDYYINQVI